MLSDLGDVAVGAAGRSPGAVPLALYVFALWSRKYWYHVLVLVPLLVHILYNKMKHCQPYSVSVIKNGSQEYKLW